MSDQNAYNKKYVDPSKQSDVEGLLEHFNLPPKVIAFLRENKRPVQICIALVVAAVVGFSLYGSYKEKNIEAGASALATALEETGTTKKDALTGVADRYSSTPAGIWAKVELAHLAMAEKAYGSAAEQYTAINSELSNDNPLFALTQYGMAQAYEADGSLDKASAAFEKLSSLEGYQLSGYLGMARILESQGELEKALGIYGQYLSIFSDEEFAPQRQLIESKIAGIKSRQ